MSSPAGSAGSCGSAGSSSTARQARSAELKNKRRITKAIAAKRSRAQHGQYVQQLTDECDALRTRIRSLKLQRDVEAVAHAMVTEMSKTLTDERAEALQSWLQASSLEGLIQRAEAREKKEREEREQAERDERREREEREALDAASDSSLPGVPSKPRPPLSTSASGKRPVKGAGVPSLVTTSAGSGGASWSSSGSSAASTISAMPVSRPISAGGSSQPVPLTSAPVSVSIPAYSYVSRVAAPSPRLTPYTGPYAAPADLVHAPRLASLQASLQASIQASPALGPARGPTPPVDARTNEMLCLLDAAEGLATMSHGASAVATPRQTPCQTGMNPNGAPPAMTLSSRPMVPKLIPSTSSQTPSASISNPLRRMASDETAAAICILAGAANGNNRPFAKRPFGGALPMTVLDESMDQSMDRKARDAAHGNRRVGGGVKRSNSVDGRAAEEADDGDDDEDEEDDDEDYCFCGTRRHLKSSFRGVWVQCDECELWCHGECARLRSFVQAERVESYVCPICKGADPASLLKTGAPLKPKRPRGRPRANGTGRPRGRPPNSSRTAAAVAARTAQAAARREAAAAAAPAVDAAAAPAAAAAALAAAPAAALALKPSSKSTTPR